MPDVFLSYSREDQATATRFAEGLAREGFSVWWDQALTAGETFDQVTEKALKDANSVIVLWSKRSVQSRWVRSEATLADRYGTLVPVMIEPCERPIMFELTHTADLSQWRGDADDSAWRALVAGLRGTRGEAGGRASTPATRTITVRRPRRVLAAGAVAVALLAIATAAALFLRGHGKAAASRAAAAAAQVSIAVLPFEDLSPDADQKHLARGIPGQILTMLDGLGDANLTVIQPTSAFAFEGQDISYQKIGETLHVANLLVGDVQKDGQHLRITARLLDAATGASRWSHPYDGSPEDIFKFQDEIARAVAQTLQLTLGVGFGRQPGMTRNVAAYEAFLAGAVNAIPSWDSVLRSISRLEEAVRLDPEFGMAWDQLAAAYAQAADTLGDRSPEEWRRLAGEADAKARRYSPDPGRELFLRIQDAMNRRAWIEVPALEQQLSTAAESLGNPGLVEAVRDTSSSIRIAVGQVTQAIPVLQRARDRDPLNPVAYARLAEALAAVDRLEEASVVYDQGLSLPGGRQMAVSALWTALATGDAQQVRRRFDALGRDSEFNATSPFFPPSLIELPRAAALAELHRLAADEMVGQMQASFAYWMAYLGDAEGALALLREQAMAGGPTLRLWRPVLHETRHLPGFKDLVRELGLVDYWRATGSWGDFCKPTTGDDFECH